MGHKPDWQNGSMKKPAGHKCTPGMQSRELFHGASKPGVQAQRFADGGEADTSAYFKDTVTQSDSGYEAIKESAPAAEAPKSFGSAFKEARASGAKDFEYNGKKYTTELAGEKKSAQAKYDVGTEEDRTFARPAKTFAEDVAERKASMMKTSEPAAAAPAPAKTASVESNPRRRYATGGSAPAADTRTKEEKIKAAKGGKFVQGRTPE